MIAIVIIASVMMIIFIINKYRALHIIYLNIKFVIDIMYIEYIIIYYHLNIKADNI